MFHLYSLIWYKNYVRCTDIVRVISGCFCSYSSMKLLYSVVCISIILFNIATILSLMTRNSHCIVYVGVPGLESLNIEATKVCYIQYITLKSD